MTWESFCMDMYPKVCLDAKRKIKRAYPGKWEAFKDAPALPAVALDASEDIGKEKLLAFLELPSQVIKIKPAMLHLKKSDIRHVLLHELAHFWQDYLYPKDKSAHGRHFKEICAALKCKYPSRWVPV